jgi:hypothetical protein
LINHRKVLQGFLSEEMSNKEELLKTLMRISIFSFSANIPEDSREEEGIEEERICKGRF